jgi:uncharacterized membrane protein
MPDTLHHPTIRFNLLLFAAYLGVAIWVGATLPERYPVHFDLSGNPTRWEERSLGMFILLVFVGVFTFAQGFLLQRFLLRDPGAPLLNIPFKELFLQLPEARRVPVMRRMNRMLGLINTMVLATFLSIILMTWWSAHQPGAWQAQLSNVSLMAALACLLIFPVVEAVALNRVIRRKLEEEGLLHP